jgi:hypothetical protein
MNMGTDAAMETTTGTPMNHYMNEMNMNTTKCGDGMMGMMVRFNLWPCNVYIRCSDLTGTSNVQATGPQTCNLGCSSCINNQRGEVATSTSNIHITGPQITHSPQLFILLEQPKLHVCGPVACTIDVPVVPNYLYS